MVNYFPRKLRHTLLSVINEKKPEIIDTQLLLSIDWECPSESFKNGKMWQSIAQTINKSPVFNEIIRVTFVKDLVCLRVHYLTTQYVFFE
jgi:hypothetical protein